MFEFLHIRTLAMFGGLLCAALAWVMIYYSLTRRTYPGFHLWTIAYVFGGLGIMLVSLRHVLPDFLSVVVGNVGYAAQVFLLTRGVALFCGAKPWTRTGLFSLLAIVAGFLYFTYLEPNVTARIVLISAIQAVFYARAGLILVRRTPALLDRPNLLAASGLLLMAVWLVMRAIATPLWEGHITDFMSRSLLQGASAAALLLSNVLVMIGLLILNTQRLELELHEANQEINTLARFLPICASCKKIRDDKGYWEGVESYISQHTGAEFTHSLCPDCARRLYPDLELKDLK